MTTRRETYEAQALQILKILTKAAKTGELCPRYTSMGDALGISSKAVGERIQRLLYLKKITLHYEDHVRVITIPKVGRLLSCLPSRPAPVISKQARKGWIPWTKEDTAIAQRMVLEGKSDREVGEVLGRTMGSVRNKTYLLREPPREPELPGVARFTCHWCGARSDAALEFGCGHCWPLRREVAPAFSPCVFGGAA